MYQNQSRDRFNPGTDLTCNASAAVAGKTFVTYSGPLKNGNITVGPAAAGDAAAGVAKYDAGEGDLVGVARGSGRVLTVTAGAALAPGAAVEVGPAGKAIPATTGTVVGWAVDAADLDADALVSLAH